MVKTRAILVFAVFIPVSVCLGQALADDWQEVSIDSIQVGSELWVYDSLTDSSRPREELLCGKRANRLAAEALNTLRGRNTKALPCTPCHGQKDCLLCRSPGPPDFNGAQLEAQSNKKPVLHAVFRWPAGQGVSEHIRHRRFLQRTQEETCAVTGPRKVWHPPRHTSFTKSVERRLARSDQSLLPKRLITYVSIGSMDGLDEDELPALVLLKEQASLLRSREQILGRPMDIGLQPSCEACGRGQKRCAECVLWSNHNTAEYFRVAPDPAGKLRIQLYSFQDPGEMFGGDSPGAAECLMHLLSVDGGSKAACEPWPDVVQ